MIVAEQKSLEEIEQMIKDYRKVLLVGCGTCVTVCFAGGQKEVGVLASELRISSKLANRELETSEKTIQRQCEWEFVDELKDVIDDCEVVVSLGCGVGVQAIAERYPGKKVFPALNTKGMATTQMEGQWLERCAGCGNCVVHNFGGICPIARCSKTLLNGPCGGSEGGRCEVNPEIDCVWQQIYDRMELMGLAESLEEIQEPKDWRTARDGGPRRIDRPDLRLETAGVKE